MYRCTTTGQLHDACELRPAHPARLPLDDLPVAIIGSGPIGLAAEAQPHGFTELQQSELNFFITGMKSDGRAPSSC